MQQRVDDAHWSLAMALAWITYRTEQAVTNISGGRWAPTKAAIRDLLSALRSGKLIAHGMFEGERIPHPIEAAVWSTFEIVVKPKMFLGQMFLRTLGTPVVIAQRMGPPQTRLLSATVPAAKVKKLWPVAKQTAAAAARLRMVTRGLRSSLPVANESPIGLIATTRTAMTAAIAKSAVRLNGSINGGSAEAIDQLQPSANIRTHYWTTPVLLSIALLEGVAKQISTRADAATDIDVGSVPGAVHSTDAG